MKILLCLLALGLAVGVSTAYAEHVDILCDKAKSAIGEQLRDPDSAQFKCAPEIISEGPHKMLLVRVNAKSSLWGYIGFETWIVVFRADGSCQAFSPGEINERLHMTN